MQCGGEGETGRGKTEGEREKEEEEEVGEEEEGRKYLRHAEIIGERELSTLNSKEASGRADEGVSSQKSEGSLLNRSVECRAEGEGVASRAAEAKAQSGQMCTCTCHHEAGVRETNGGRRTRGSSWGAPLL